MTDAYDRALANERLMQDRMQRAQGAVAHKFITQLQMVEMTVTIQAHKISALQDLVEKLRARIYRLEQRKPPTDPPYDRAMPNIGL